MYELIQTSILDSSNKEFEVNRLLADIVSRYIALYEIYGDEKICNKFLDEALDPRVINLLQSYGFLQMYPEMSSLLASAKDAEMLLQNDDSDKSLLQKINSRYKKLMAPKSNRCKLLQSFLEQAYLRCYKSGGQGISSVHYSESDLQILIGLVPALIPNHIKEYQAQKDYKYRVQAFGKRLNVIKNKSIDSDYTVLLAIVDEFKKHDFVLDWKFKAAVAKNHVDFVGINKFLSQKRVLATLLAINIEVVSMDLGYRDVREALDIIGAINNNPKAVLEKSDITLDTSRQAHLFVKSFCKPNPKSSQYIVFSGLRSARTLVQQALSVCKYLIVGADISLISLSLVAGPSVFITNAILILSMSVVAIFAFIADASCSSIDKVSAKFYDASLNLCNKILDKDNKMQGFVVGPDYSIEACSVGAGLGSVVRVDQARSNDAGLCPRYGAMVK